MKTEEAQARGRAVCDWAGPRLKGATLDFNIADQYLQFTKFKGFLKRHVFVIILYYMGSG